MDRKQFTFYRSYWDAVRELPEEDKLPVLEAIISYALDGEIPTSLTQVQRAFFTICKPTLDTARKKAESGKRGGEAMKPNRDDDFDAFWKAYPRKVNKQGAVKAFEKVDVDVEILIGAIENHKRSAQWTKDGGAFIPHPTTWLNQRRWEEELAPDKTIPKGASGIMGDSEKDALKQMLGG